MGPFGRGWDFNLNARIVDMPLDLLPQDFKLVLNEVSDALDTRFDVVAHPGDVLLIDGLGTVRLFRRMGGCGERYIPDDEEPGVADPIDTCEAYLAEPADPAPGPAAPSGVLLPEVASDDICKAYRCDPALDAFEWSDRIVSYYFSPAGVFAALYRLSDGSWVLISPRGNRAHYDADGKLRRLVDAFPASQTVLSYRTDGKLDRVTNDRGHPMTFNYYASSSVHEGDIEPSEASHLGLIAKVTTPSEHVSYEYDINGALIVARNSSGQTMFYGYQADPPHLLSTVGSDPETPSQTVTYADGLVTQTTKVGETIVFGGAVSTAKSLYGADEPIALTTKVDEHPVVTHQIDRLGRPWAGADEEGRSLANNDGLLTTVQQRASTSTFEFDEANKIHRYRGNLLAAGRNDITLVEMTYDGSAWNRLSTKTDHQQGVIRRYTYTPTDMTTLDEPGDKLTVQEATMQTELSSGPVERRVVYGYDGSTESESWYESETLEVTHQVLYDAEGLPIGERLGTDGLEQSKVVLTEGTLSQVSGRGFSFDVDSVNSLGQVTAMGGTGVPTVNVGL